MTIAADSVKPAAPATAAGVPEQAAERRLGRYARPALGLLLPAALAVAWEVAVRRGWSSGRLAPPPSVILATFADLARSGDLARHTSVTLARVAAGFVIGTVAATIIGAATGSSAWLRRLVDPSLQALRAIPSIAWVPLFILWLGIFEASKVTLIAVGVFFPVYLGLMGAIQSQADRSRPHFPALRRRHGGGFSCPRCCRPTSLRCARASGSAGCSSSPPS
jgi:sulfonate transport system permease protein